MYLSENKISYKLKINCYYDCITYMYIYIINLYVHIMNQLKVQYKKPAVKKGCAIYKII